MRRRERQERSDKWSGRVEIPEESHSNGVLPHEVQLQDILAQVNSLDRDRLNIVRDYIDSLLGPRDPSLREADYR